MNSTKKECITWRDLDLNEEYDTDWNPTQQS
jgi:hypothetical protein